MTTYVVYKAVGGLQIAIGLVGYDPEGDPGFIKVGTFDLDVDELNSQTSPETLATRHGDHIFIVKAREVLAKNDYFKDANLDAFTFLDRASNAATHMEDVGTLEATEDSEPGTLPDASSQKGGLTSTVGTDPADTDANGVTPKQERTDEGETADTSDQSDEQMEQAKVPDASDPAGDANTDDAGHPKEDDQYTKPAPTPSVNSEAEAPEPETTEEAPAEADTAKPETVADLKTRIATITDKDELQSIYENEKAGPNRATALAAIEARAAELSAE